MFQAGDVRTVPPDGLPDFPLTQPEQPAAAFTTAAKFLTKRLRVCVHTTPLYEGI